MVKIISERLLIECDTEEERATETQKYVTKGYDIIDYMSGHNKYYLTVKKEIN